MGKYIGTENFSYVWEIFAFHKIQFFNLLREKIGYKIRWRSQNIPICQNSSTHEAHS